MLWNLAPKIGFLFSVSHIAIPAISEAPSELALSQFKNVFYGGHIIGPVCAINSSAAYGYSAYKNWQETPKQLGRHWHMLAAASALSVAAIIYTFIFLGPLNRRLLQLFGAPGLVKSGEVHKLVHEWGSHNSFRCGLLFIASVTAVSGIF